MEPAGGHVFDKIKANIRHDLSSSEDAEIRQLLKENGALITSSTDRDVIVVAQNFEHPDLKRQITGHFSTRNPALIAGTHLIRACAQRKMQIPVERLPLLSLLFENVKVGFALLSKGRTDPSAKVLMLGGTVLDHPQDGMTHLIIGRDALESPEAIPVTFGAKVVSREWVMQCWKQLAILPEKNFPYLPFNNMVISLSGIQPASERSKYANMITKLGASFSPDLKADVTHLVIDEDHVDVSPNGKFAWASEWKKKIVKHNWVLECYECGYLISETLFLVSIAAPKVPVHDEAQTSIIPNSAAVGSGVVPSTDDFHNPDEESSQQQLFFEGRVLALLNFPNDINSTYTAAIWKAGGSTDQSQPKKVTHFVIYNAEANMRSVVFASQFSALVVSEEWLHESISRKQCISGAEVNRYRLQAPSDHQSPVASSRSDSSKPKPSTSKRSTTHPAPTHTRDPAMEPPPAKRAKVAAVPVGEPPAEPATQEQLAPRGTLFADKIVYFPHIEKKDPDFDRARIWVEQEGGLVIHEFDNKNPSCDFTVLPHGFTLGETEQSAPGVLVSPNYIIVSGSCSKLLDVRYVAGFKPLSAPPENLKTILSGKSITISQFRKTWEKNSIIMMIELLGGHYDPAFKKARTTHVISNTDNGDKFVAAVQNGRHVVNKEWLNDSAEFGYPADESKYSWPDVVAALIAAHQAAFDRDAAAREALLGIDPNDFNYTASKTANNDMMDVDGDVDATGRDDPMDVPATGMVPNRTNLVHPTEPVLAGVRLYVGKVTDPDAARTIAAELGAEIAWDCDVAVTHVLWQGKHEVKNSAVKAARDRRVPFVSPFWLLDCRKHMKRAIEAQFPPEMNPVNALVLDYVPSATTVKAPSRTPQSATGGVMGPPTSVPKRHQPSLSSATKFLDEEEDPSSSLPERAASQPTPRERRSSTGDSSDIRDRLNQTQQDVSVSFNHNPSEISVAPASMAPPAPAAAAVTQPEQTRPLTQRPTIPETRPQISTPVEARISSPPKAISQPPKQLVIQHDVERQEEKKRQVEEDNKRLSSILKMIPGQSKTAENGESVSAAETFASRKRYELVPDQADQAHLKHAVQALNSASAAAHAADSSQDDGITISSSQYAEPMSGSQSLSHHANVSSAAVIGYRRSEEDSVSRAPKTVRNRNFSGLVDELNRSTPSEREQENAAASAHPVEMHQSSGFAGKSQSGFGISGVPKPSPSPQVAPSPKKPATTAALGNSKTTTIQSSLNKLQKRYNIGLSGYPTENNRPRQEAINAIQRLGGEFSNGNGNTLTHLVAVDTPRSPKIISSLAYGRWILRPEWITESDKAGRFLPEEKFEWRAAMVNAPSAQQDTAGACRLNRLRKEQRGLKPDESLFKGMRIACYFKEKAETFINMLASSGFTLLHDLSDAKPGEYVTHPRSLSPFELKSMGCDLFFTDRSGAAEPKMADLVAQDLVPVVTTSYLSDFLLKVDTIDPIDYHPHARS